MVVDILFGVGVGAAVVGLADAVTVTGGEVEEKAGQEEI